ncbi:hypothetical protein [Bacillus suaedaesalsae]|uniref:Uncharacterized protein n=1 Tax=Bacillus suaedaesalsae TaxID=2810349 RepID=A0ABS2DHH0_9BACI|nr:hypothetical protein [Bacillus suaedaesalsae]MBM6617929.1 hypothetical protein [Bacillus suaedaesalsae]
MWFFIGSILLFIISIAFLHDVKKKRFKYSKADRLTDSKDLGDAQFYKHHNQFLDHYKK